MQVLQHFSGTVAAASQALGQVVQDPAVQQAFGGLGQLAAGQQASETRLLAAQQASEARLLAAMQAMQGQLADVLGRLDVLAAKQGNQPARAHNAVTLAANELQPLGKEDAGGQHALGTLPPAAVPFPATRLHLEELTRNQLDELAVFYCRGFAGANIAARRRAFRSFIGILN